MLIESNISLKKKIPIKLIRFTFVLKRKILLGNNQRKKNIEYDSLRDSNFKRYAQTFYTLKK